MTTPQKTTTRNAQSPWSLHANALNLMAQRGETTAMKRAIDSGADINECDRDWFPLMMAVYLGVPLCRDAFTPSTRIVSRNDGSGWFLFRI